MMRRVRSLVRDRFHWILVLSAGLCLPVALLLATVAADIGAAAVLLVAVPIQLGMAVQILRLRTLRREVSRGGKVAVRQHRQVMRQLKRPEAAKRAPVTDNAAQWRRVRDGWDDSVGVLRLDAELYHREILETLAQHHEQRAGLGQPTGSEAGAQPSEPAEDAATAGPSVGRRRRWGDWSGIER